MRIVDKIAEQMKEFCQNFAILKDTGKILLSDFEDKILLPIVERSASIFSHIGLHEYYHKPPLYIYRLSENLLLLLISRESELIIEELFEDITTKYSEILAKKYSGTSQTLNDLISTIIFGTARQMGPEPIAAVTKKTLEEDKLDRLTMAAMMVLTGELGGAKKRLINFHPFISHNLFGIIYLFQIPLEKARGYAFDSALILLTELENRAIVYNFHNELEKMLSKFADAIVEEFIKQASEDIHGPLPDLEEFQKILGRIFLKLDKLIVDAKTSEETQVEMLDALRSLKG